MAAASSPARPINRSSCDAAAKQAASSWVTSSSGVPFGIAVRVRMRRNAIRPMANPSDATWAGKIRSGRVLIEVALDEADQRFQRLRGIVSIGPEEDGRAHTKFETHHAHDALGIDPVLRPFAPHPDFGIEALGELGQLHGRPRMETHLMGDEDGAFGRVRHHCFQARHRGESSSAVARTAWRLPPPAASVAAITAPSTIGALQTTTLSRRSSGSISIAISLLLSAPPRSTRIATPLGDQALSMAARIEATSVPSPPAGLPPLNAIGISLPTIWRTMSMVPLATSCE